MPSFFDTLVARARARLSEADAPAAPSPDSAARLAALTYDEHRALRFRPERSLWRGEPGRFEVQLFHLGYRHLTPVPVHVLRGERDTLVEYDPGLFVHDRGDLALPRERDLGFAGLRVHAPMESETYRDELIVFLGASYFRSRGLGQAYGLSARGLAIDTGEGGGEEFPRFSELWLVRPGPDDEHVWILASLDGPRATGAYAFRVTPGAPTSVEVRARVFFRETPGVVGVAPLTSMYLFGEDDPAHGGDFRPEVHDSDVLLVHDANGERLCRPLRNPPRTTVSTFRVSPGLRGFGLAQRDREFASYQDLEASYERRPSAWVEPIGEWSPGAIRLLEISTELETDDNVAAMFVPDEIPPDGLDLRYRILFGEESPSAGEGARVVATRVARGGQFVDDDVVRIFVDLSGPAAADAARLEGAEWVADARGAEIVETLVVPNPHIGGARAMVAFRAPQGVDEVDLRAFLRSGGEALSETWVYLWQRPRG